MNRKILFGCFCLLLNLNVRAQLTLEHCYERAQVNYPLAKRMGLIEQSLGYTLENAAKGNLPQLSVTGKASYQSDVTKLPIDVSNFGINIKDMSRDQYQLYAEVDQKVYDGGAVSTQQRLAKAETEVARRQQTVDMYTLYQRVNELFFGVLLIDEQLKLNQLLLNDLGREETTVGAYIRGGVANESDLDAVKAEILSNQQTRTGLNGTREAYLLLLGQLIGEKISTDAQLAKPEARTTSALDVNARPELNLFTAQTARLDEQEKAIDVKLRPRVGLFLQGGVGRPALNMLENKIKPYYVAGLRFSWNLGSLYTRSNEKRLLANNREQITTAQETFLFNTRLESTQQQQANETVRRQMAADEEIINLRHRIRLASEAKVAHGTMTVTDMLRDLTRENSARQSRSLHEIQWLKGCYEINRITGNH